MKMIKKILVIAIIVSAPLFINAQPTPPEGGNGGYIHGSGGNHPAGGGAPIDGGLSILLLLGAAYGGNKVYFKKKQED